MWTPLALAATLVLTAAQPPAAGALNLANVRNTYGELGGTRPETGLLPGDVLFVGFDIENISIDPVGQVKYTMAMEVLDKAGKQTYKNDPVEKTDFVPLGGQRLPGRAYVTIGLDQAPGEYTLKLTVVDQANKATKTLEKKFNVVPRDFGIVAVYTSVDERGTIPAPTTGIVGQSVYVQFSVIGFGRDPAKKQPNMLFEMTPLDEAGRPTIQKASALPVEAGVDEKEPGFSVRFLVPMTRTGKFTVRLKATDRVANKAYTFDLPLAVVPSAN